MELSVPDWDIPAILSPPSGSKPAKKSKTPKKKGNVPSQESPSIWKLSAGIGSVNLPHHEDTKDRKSQKKTTKKRKRETDQVKHAAPARQSQHHHPEAKANVEKQTPISDREAGGGKGKKDGNICGKEEGKGKGKRKGKESGKRQQTGHGQGDGDGDGKRGMEAPMNGARQNMLSKNGARQNMLSKKRNNHNQSQSGNVESKQPFRETAKNEKQSNGNQKQTSEHKREKKDVATKRGREDDAAHAKRKKKKDARKKSVGQPSGSNVKTSSSDDLLLLPFNKPSSGSSMQSKMKQKLDGARFRWLNEQMYTATGKSSFKLFQDNPEFFEEYHKGFRSQVQSWPTNPVNVFIKQLKSQPKGAIVADFGCGDAKIAQSVKQKVHSFDLIAKNKLVTACDMAKVPLKDEVVDIAIFCLSLMGTDYWKFLLEARRVLKIGGLLKIAEVVSRFEDTRAFIESLDNIGFDLLEENHSNKMFFLLTLEKTDREVEDSEKGVALKPCIYKRR